MGRALLLAPADVRAIYDYDRAVFERYARRIARLPWVEATREQEIGHHSMFGTLVHVLNVHEAWMAFVVPGLSDKQIEAKFEDPTRHPTSWKGFHRYAQRVWTSIDATIARLGPRSVGRRVRAPWMPGVYTVRDAVMQATLEQAHHLGEIIAVLWQRDLAPPAMTWIDVRRASDRKGSR